MASNSPLCQTCEQRKITKPATELCPKCTAYFCNECKEFHDISPMSKQHVTIALSAINTLDSFIPFQETKCKIHNEEFQLLCQHHDQMICLSCIPSHSSCKDVVSLSDVVAGIKDSELFREANTALSESLDNMTTIIKVLNENQEGADDNHDQMKREVDKLCDQVVSRVRDAQEKMKAEIDGTTQKIKSAVLEASDDLQNRKAKTTELQAQLKSVKIYGSELQIYKALREIITKTQKNDEHIHELINTGKTDKVQLSLVTNDEIKRILKVEQLATLNTEKIPVKIVMKKSKEKQAQIIQPKKQSSFDEIKLNRGTSFPHQCGNLTGLSVLPDGKILICDYNGTNPIAVVDGTGKLVSTIPVPGKYVCDVAVIDQNTLAVTSGSDETISIVDIQSSSIKKSITTDNYCYGITYLGQHLYCCVRYKGIIKMSVKTGNSSLLYRTDMSYYSYITNHNNKLFFTDYITHTVTCCDMEGKEIWKYTNPSVLNVPHGISVDKYGNIFVNGRKKSCVVMLSEDGKKSRQVLNKDNGLGSPQALCFDAVRNRLLVGNEIGDVLIYNFA